MEAFEKYQLLKIFKKIKYEFCPECEVTIEVVKYSNGGIACRLCDARFESFKEMWVRK